MTRRRWAEDWKANEQAKAGLAGGPLEPYSRREWSAVWVVAEPFGGRGWWYQYLYEREDGAVFLGEDLLP